MAVFKPFAAIRPLPEYAQQVAALPYDVMSSAEARELAEGNPCSFLHVDKAEIDLDPCMDPYDARVYQKARENLDQLVADGVCKQDAKPCFYIYRQIMDGRAQTGLVGCASIDDYRDNVIKKHELTRADKEADRIRHVDTCDANTGPIFLTCRPQAKLLAIMESWKASYAPAYDFAQDGVQQTVWVVEDDAVNTALSNAIAQIKALYIADGHHRAASAVRVGEQRREANPGYTGEEDFNFFLAVLFLSDELAIMDYNRVVRDLNGYSEEAFLKTLEDNFKVAPCTDEGAFHPAERHTFGLYLGGKWYSLRAKAGTFPEGDPVASLDVSILQENLLGPVLGIGDPRTDKRIDFVGGIRGLGELERRANSDMILAFSMCPTTLEELMAIADAGKVMPPKSTWFEPKLLSGLFIHRLA